MNNLDKIFIKEFVSKLHSNPFEVRLWDGEEFLVGEGDPVFKVCFNNPLSKKDLLTSTSLTLGEAYMRNDISIDGDLLVTLDTLFGCQKDHFHTNFAKLGKIFSKAGNEKKQKSEVCYHYNLGNDFYSLWLDKTLSYSCAYFKNENDTLYEAQMNKIHYILKKLQLSEGETLLDIGCGWGYLLIEAAKKYKVKGTGITLSEEQYKKFQERIEKEGLEDYLEVKLMDYRDLEHSGMSFDKIVSVGMLEHVGREHYDLYLKNVNSVLKPKGLFLLHYISGLTESPGDAWIKKYIFPGGVIPSLREIIDLFPKYNFYTLDVESLRRHYTRTLIEWYKNFDKERDTVKGIFGEEFVRMWDLYLTSCAACFNNGVIDLHQILISKDVNNEIKMTRAYMYED